MINFPRPDIEQYLRSFAITHFTVSPDESSLVFNTNLSGEMNLWKMDLPNQFPYQVSFHNENSHIVSYDPEKRYLLTGIDHDGDENYQIYALPINGGVPLPVVTGERNEKFYYGHLSEDGERIYYTTNKNNPTFLNIRIYNLKTEEDTMLFKGDEAPCFLEAVSPDEETFIYLQAYANTYQLLYVHKDGESLPLTPDPKAVHTTSSPVYMDNQTVYFVTNYQSKFSYLASFNLETKTFKEVLKIDGREMTDLVYHKESKTVYLVAEHGVVDELYAYDVETGQFSEIDIPIHTINQLKVAKSGNLYLLGNSAVEPSNIYQKEIGKEWVALSNNRVMGVSSDELVNPEIVTYKSYDDTPIESLFFKANPEVTNGYTVFWPHGGPQSSERKSYRSYFQFLTGIGYNVFAPNFRGSTGYGAEFVKLVEQDWGHGPRLDCVEGIKWLFENGYSDREHLFLLGGSYGGYMSLLLAGRHPDYFRAVVDIFGPSDLFSFYNSVPEEWKPIMKLWLGDPEKDRERFIKDSPITYLDGMKKPMLIIQGANDPRVVKKESDQIVEALRGKDVEVEYLVMENEGHGFSKKENEVKAFRMIADFFEKYQS
ncbi:Dipeptidyl aminopeptidase/acylaminoacyl peptidase [Salinibacillus kushneri]|uniref:Dipeptidyl aminopeptidase/acylaminoacyl peptidase n=1 Tax=Salinibacillus kushneri TaxID=237682 RepID=A0A1I0ESX4_9BACI|nr:S9 family peptidase [Salinibacillus kushneri]SET48457.1 Dipeptidyl aminopeptidase/acylaminoacyl peptidase [Salinibacillus kushneri]